MRPNGFFFRFNNLPSWLLLKSFLEFWLRWDGGAYRYDPRWLSGRLLLIKEDAFLWCYLWMADISLLELNTLLFLSSLYVRYTFSFSRSMLNLKLGSDELIPTTSCFEKLLDPRLSSLSLCFGGRADSGYLSNFFTNAVSWSPSRLLVLILIWGLSPRFTLMCWMLRSEWLLERRPDEISPEILSSSSSSSF